MAGMPDPLTDLPPPSRFDPDELNAFAASDVQPSPPLIVWAPWAKTLLQSGVLQPQLALFCVSDVGIHLLHQIPNKRIVGSIVLPEISMVSAILMIHDVDYFLNYVKFAVILCFFVKFEPLAFHKVQ